MTNEILTDITSPPTKKVKLSLTTEALSKIQSIEESITLQKKQIEIKIKDFLDKENIQSLADIEINSYETEEKELNEKIEFLQQKKKELDQQIELWQNDTTFKTVVEECKRTAQNLENEIITYENQIQTLNAKFSIIKEIQESQADQKRKRAEIHTIGAKDLTRTIERTYEYLF